MVILSKNYLYGQKQMISVLGSCGSYQLTEVFFIPASFGYIRAMSPPTFVPLKPVSLKPKSKPNSTKPATTSSRPSSPTTGLSASSRCRSASENFENSHQVVFNEMIRAGVPGLQAMGHATSQVGWAFYLSSSLYGVNGAYGVSGIAQGLVNTEQKR